MPKYDLELNPPIMNAAGCLGFAPDLRGSLDLTQLGAFITNPISWNPRTPAKGTRLIYFPGGVLMHTGYPNPGFRLAVRKYSPRWERSPVPILVNILVQSIDEVQEMILKLENTSGVAGIELGLPPDGSEEFSRALLTSLSSELPIIIRVPIAQAVVFSTTFYAEIELNISGISLSPARGMLTDTENNLVSGRLYGPALFPQTLAAVHQIAQIGLTVIAGGGVYSKRQVQELLSAGAAAVQLDTVLWRGVIPSL